MPTINNLPIKLYADGADLPTIKRLAALPYIAGITTNPSLMRKAGVEDYRGFVREVVFSVPDKPVSFEVLSDDHHEMRRQAMDLHSFGSNVFVKIPVVNSRGETCIPLARELSRSGVKVNVTAILTRSDLLAASMDMDPGAPLILSVFAGRISDTGRDPAEMITSALPYLEGWAARAGRDLLWASTREVYNIMQASACGCSVITVPAEILAKAEKFLGYDLTKLTAETVQQFTTDAAAAGYTLS